MRNIKNKVSVIISTYNGEKYIKQQLDSIYSQSYKPDEVLIFDDKSSDETATIVQNYINVHACQDFWTLIVNESNKGCTRNFLEGALSAKGDIIFYSDQDDIWDKQKIEIMLEPFEDKAALAVCCFLDCIDENGDKLANQLFALSRPHKIKKIYRLGLYEKMRCAYSPGLCIAFKRELLPEVKEMIEKYDLPHDIPIGTVASLHNGYYCVNKKLVHYRIHGNNLSAPDTSFIGTSKRHGKQIKSRKIKLREYQALLDVGEQFLNTEEKKEITKSIKCTEKIIQALDSNSLMSLLRCIPQQTRLMNKFLFLRNIASILIARKD
jgi:glycosyltransferase involved in cell wall biosynthesis